MLLLASGCQPSYSRREIRTPDAPEAIGPYAQAVEASGFVFVSGQIAIDPATKAMIQGDTAAQTERVLLNIEAILRAAGLGMKDVVKTTVFMIDLADFTAMNEAYTRFFRGDPPARATVQVVALPRDARVEIEAVAAR